MAGRNLKYILVCGPQASGKTTLIGEIAREFPDAVVYSEVGKEVLEKYGLRGGAFVDKDAEEEILERGLKRLKEIAGGDGVHIDETGIFNVAHARSLGYRELAKEYLPKYLDVMRRIPCDIRFLDVKPEVSWDRRAKEYRDRGFAEEELVECRDKIERSYEEFVGLYNEVGGEFS